MEPTRDTAALSAQEDIGAFLSRCAADLSAGQPPASYQPACTSHFARPRAIGRVAALMAVALAACVTSPHAKASGTYESVRGVYDVSGAVERADSSMKSLERTHKSKYSDVFDLIRGVASVHRSIDGVVGTTGKAIGGPSASSSHASQGSTSRGSAQYSEPSTDRAHIDHGSVAPRGSYGPDFK